jgi:tetratricopeptide (TPR) repeat protein
MLSSRSFLLLLLAAGAEGGKRKQQQQVLVDPSGNMEQKPEQQAEKKFSEAEIVALAEEVSSRRRRPLSKKTLQRLADSIHLAPSDARLYATLGIGLCGRKGATRDDKIRGVRHLREALQLNPLYPDLHRTLAKTLQERTPPDRWARNEAVELYKTALRLRPDDSDIYYQLGRLHDQVPLPTVDEFEDAVGSANDTVHAEWQHALQLRPDWWLLHKEMSARLCQSNDQKLRERAITHAQRAVELEPRRAELYFGLATAVLRTDAPLPAGLIGPEQAQTVRPNPRLNATGYLMDCIDVNPPPRVYADAYHTLGMLMLTAGSGNIPTYRKAHEFIQIARKLRPSEGAFIDGDTKAAIMLERVLQQQEMEAAQANGEARQS